jgi:hypothetical protein
MQKACLDVQETSRLDAFDNFTRLELKKSVFYSFLVRLAGREQSTASDLHCLLTSIIPLYIGLMIRKY